MKANPAAELARLKRTVAPESSQFDMLIRIPVECDPGCSEAVLSRIKEVMEAVVVRLGESDWPDAEAWRSILPEWFVDQCADEKTAEENEAWLRWWRSLPPSEQAEASANAPWALLDWLHWFAPGPDQRQWTWWSGSVESETTISIVLAAEGWPTAHGAFDWIVRAAGAKPLEEEPITSVS